MVKTSIIEPYYLNKPTHIKPVGPRKSFTLEDDLKYIRSSFNSDPKVAPNIELSANEKIWGKNSRSNSLEPYFGKHKLSFSDVSDNYNYTYDGDDQLENALVSEGEDDEDEDAMLSKLLHKQYCRAEYTRPPGRIFTRADVTDDYEELSEEESDHPVVSVLQNSPCFMVMTNDKFEILDIPEDLSSSQLIEKSNNPNILMNSRSRNLSSILKAPAILSLDVNACFENDDVKLSLRDDYDYENKARFVV